MENIKIISKKNLEKAFEIINELKIKEIWESFGAKCNLVGSVSSGLLMDKLDIDFHTYSDDFSIEKSFSAISQICKNPKIKEVSYKNLLDVEDMCLEWHLWYEETPERIWTIDIMHIKNESAYAGAIERVTEKIKSVLTENKRLAILRIKWECKQQKESAQALKKGSTDNGYHGIDIYQAVIDYGIETFEDFKKWKENKKDVAISLWEPN